MKLFKPEKDLVKWRNGEQELRIFCSIKWIDNTLLLFTRSWYKYITCNVHAIKYKFQELTRGYSDLDLWNIKTYCAKKMIPVLKHIKKDLMSTPLRLHEVDRFGNIVERDLEKIDRFSDESHFTEDEWRGVLDEMIFAFTLELDQDDPDFEKKYKVYPQNYNQWKDTFWKKHEENGDSYYTIESKTNVQPDYTELNKAYKRQKNGLKLFALYYPNLWD